MRNEDDSSLEANVAVRGSGSAFVQTIETGGYGARVDSEGSCLFISSAMGRRHRRSVPIAPVERRLPSSWSFWDCRERSRPRAIDHGDEQREALIRSAAHRGPDAQAPKVKGAPASTRWPFPGQARSPIGC